MSKPGAQAVAEATELRNITHTGAADPTVGIAWRRFSQNYREACPWGDSEGGQGRAGSRA
jgi:hypothetical protein